MITKRMLIMMIKIKLMIFNNKKTNLNLKFLVKCKITNQLKIKIKKMKKKTI